MAKFPTREADVGAMAGTIISGLTEYAEEFPACPVSVKTMQDALNRYNTAKDAAAIGQRRVRSEGRSAAEHEPWRFVR